MRPRDRARPLARTDKPFRRGSAAGRKSTTRPCNPARTRNTRHTLKLITMAAFLFLVIIQLLDDSQIRARESDPCRIRLAPVPTLVGQYSHCGEVSTIVQRNKKQTRQENRNLNPEENSNQTQEPSPEEPWNRQLKSNPILKRTYKSQTRPLIQEIQTTNNTMNRQRTTIAVTKQEANDNERELSNKPKVTPSFLQKSEPYEEQYRHIDTRQRANIYNTNRQPDTRHNRYTQTNHHKNEHESTKRCLTRGKLTYARNATRRTKIHQRSTYTRPTHFISRNERSQIHTETSIQARKPEHIPTTRRQKVNLHKPNCSNYKTSQDEHIRAI